MASNTISEEEQSVQMPVSLPPSPLQSCMNRPRSRSPNSPMSHQTPGVAPGPSSAQLKMSPAGSKTPDSTTGCRSPGSPGSPIGEDSCPICLGPFTDKCAAGSCLHNFCLVCLKEWCKQRPVCPLCKQPFTKILYDIKSEADYKEWNVPIIHPSSLNDIGLPQFRGIGNYFVPIERRFFGYRTTLPRLRDRRNAIPSSQPSSHRARQHHDRGSSLFRLSIYANNVWVQPLADLGRYRESSPALYREQTALTHRLVPWINRELAALISPSRIAVVLSNIMELIERYPIDSREFREAIRPELGSRTRHFVHEFYNFARSPYDMVGHDNASQYVPRYNQEGGSSAEDNDSDVIIEVESDGVVIEPESLGDISITSHVAREETIDNDGSVFISSDSDSSVNGDANESSYTHSAANASNSQSNAVRLNSLLTRTRNLFAKITEQPLTEVRNRTSNSLEEPGPSGVSSCSSLSVRRDNRSRGSNSDSDECLIVDVLKPKKERTPELINLSSNSESETSQTRENKTSGCKTHWKKKISKKAIEGQDSSKHLKNRKKPRLDRTSFSLHFSGTLNCQRRVDHNYFTESASPCNQSSNRTESEDDRCYQRRHLPRHQSQRHAESKASISFDSDSTTNEELTGRSSHVSKHKRQKPVGHRKRKSSVSRSRSPSSGDRKQTKGRANSSSKLSIKSGKKKSSKREDIPASAFQSKSRITATSTYNFREASISVTRKRQRRRYSSSSSSSSACSSTSDSDSFSCISSSSKSSSFSTDSSSSSSSNSFASKHDWERSVNSENSSDSDSSARAASPRKVSHKRNAKRVSSRTTKKILKMSDSERSSRSKAHTSRSKSGTHTTKRKKHSK